MSAPANSSSNNSPTLLQQFGNAVRKKFGQSTKVPTFASASTNSMVRSWEERVAKATDRETLKQIQKEGACEITAFLEKNGALFEDKDGTALVTISTSLLTTLDEICNTQMQLLTVKEVQELANKIEKLGTNILEQNQDPVKYYATEVAQGKSLLADLKNKVIAITENDKDLQIATAEKIFNSRLADIANLWIKAEDEFLKGPITMYGAIIDAPTYLATARDRSDKLAVIRALPQLPSERCMTKFIYNNYQARQDRLEGLRAFAPKEMHSMIDQSIQAYSYLQQQVAELAKNRTEYAKNEALRQHLRETEFELNKLLDDYKQLTSGTAGLLEQVGQGKLVDQARLVQLKQQIAEYKKKLELLFPHLNALASGLEINFERNGAPESSEITSLTPQRAVLDRLSQELQDAIVKQQIAEWEATLKASVTLFKGGVLDHPEIYQEQLTRYAPEDGILQASSNLLMQWRRITGTVATQGSAFSYGGIRKVSDDAIANIRNEFQAARGDKLGPALQEINSALKTCQEKDREKLITLQKRFTAENWAKDLYVFLTDPSPKLEGPVAQTQLHASIIERARQVFLDVDGHLPAETVKSITYAALRMVNHADLTDRQLLDQLMPLLEMIKEVVEKQPVGQKGHPDFLEVVNFLQDYNKACKATATGKVSINQARKLEHRYYLLPITIPAIEVVDKARKPGRCAIVTANLLAVADLGRDTSGDFRFNCRLCNLTAVGNTQWFKFPRVCLDWICAAGRWLYSWISSEQGVVTPVKQATEDERRAIPSGITKVNWEPSVQRQEMQQPTDFDASKLREVTDQE